MQKSKAKPARKPATRSVKKAAKKPTVVTPAAKLLKDPVFALSNLLAAATEIAVQTDATQKDPAAVLAEHYRAVRHAEEALDAVHKSLNETIRKLSREIIPAAFERDNVTSFTLASGYRVGVSSAVRASISDEGKLTVWHINNKDTGGLLGSSLTEKDASLQADKFANDGLHVDVGMKTYTGKEAGYWWLRCNQLGDLITETVNSNTLSAAMKKRLEGGLDAPEDLIPTALVPNTSLTKVKEK